MNAPELQCAGLLARMLLVTSCEQLGSWLGEQAIAFFDGLCTIEQLVVGP